jgi:hypothetical protein
MITLLTVAAIWMNEYLDNLCHMNSTAGTTYAFSNRWNIYRNFERLQYSLEFSILHWKYRCEHIDSIARRTPAAKYFNYIQYHSIVLQAAVDANLKFVTVDIGAYGKQNDGGVFRNSALYQGLETWSLQVPEDTVLPHSGITLPHFFFFWWRRVSSNNLLNITAQQKNIRQK